MIVDQIGPYVSAALLLGLSGVIGIPMIRKLIDMHEARHELRYGSAGFLRMTAGWGVVMAWLLITWFLATILGDWATNGDLDAAVERSWLRLQIILELIAAFADN